MAVLVEAISVIVRVSTLTNKYPNGWEGYRDDCPNQTLCADNEIARVGFMSPDEVEDFVNELEQHGIVYRKDGKSIEIAVIDQQRGLMAPCDWLVGEKTSITKGDKTYTLSGCSLVDSKEGILYFPEGWDYEKSLTKQFHFMPLDE